jgi:rod shape-determining protein MreC
MMFPKKNWTILIASLLILAALVVIFFGLKQTSETGFMRKLVLASVWPLESVKNRSVRAIRESWNRYLFLVGLEEENRQLKKKNDLLASQLIQYREGHLEALRLRQLLEIREQPHTTPVIAEVMGHEQSSVFKSILIKKGTAHGLIVGLPVLNDQGIVGRITECSWHACRIMLIVDKSSNVSALLQGSRTHGVLQGDGAAGCRLKYIPKTEAVNIGDAVISSGLGGIFPKGVILGVVAAIDKKEGAFFQRIDVRPSVDFGKLEEVLVLNLQKDSKR